MLPCYKAKLTKRGVCGETIDPILPKVEQVPINECLILVGNISLVST